MQRQSIYLLIKKRQARRQQPVRKLYSFFDGLARVLLSVLALAVCLTFLIGGVYYASLTHDLPSIEQLPVLLDKQNGELLQPTRLMDRSGSQALASLENDGIARHFLSVDPDAADHFSLQLIRLSTAALDPSFWLNSGTSSLFDTQPQPRTIAERLVKTLLLASEPDSARTALRMRILASEVVKRYGRTQTLEWYLNSVYLGHLSYGIDSAAQLYLHKSAADLDLAESALLVSLAESPALNPADAPTAALENQQALLTQLNKAGSITNAEYAAAKTEKLTLFGAGSPTATGGNEYLQLVERQLDAELGQDRVERGGLVVITSLDADLQTQLECSARAQLAQIEPGLAAQAPKTNTCPSASLVPTQTFNWAGAGGLNAAGLILDPGSGQVLAYLSPISLGGDSLQADYQPGTLVSPFVALAAFARGTSPATLEWDVPATLPADLSGMQNPDGKFHGPVNVRAALANDYPVPLAALMEQMDAQTVWSLTDATGFSSPKQSGATASLLFSGGQSSLLEIAQAYATLAAEGSKKGALDATTGKIDPVLVLKVQSASGQTLIDNTVSASQSVLSSSLTYLINNVLSDETARWTSLGHPNVTEIGRTAAVKLGQVTDKDQVWTVGYTPDRLVLTWMGENPKAEQSAPLDPNMPAGLWHALMQYSTQNFADHTWSEPADVSTIQVCVPSGMLPTTICPNIANDVFLMGNEPTQADTLYVKLDVNRETGLLATVFTPVESIEEGVFLNVPANLRDWASSAGLKVAPQGYDAIAVTQPNPQVQITSPSLFSPISGKVTISGTAATSDFASYSVQVGQGINPQDWQQVATGTTAVSNGQLAEWDTTGLDGLYAIRLNVVAQNNQIQTSVIQVTVDNVPPVIQITSLSDGDQIQPRNNVLTLSATVTDEVSVAKVEWWIDGKLIGSRTQPPFTYLWTPVPGKHTLQIKASDSAGNQSASEIVNFQVLP
jgi:Membrane carboxypeptidase (penicillin-binding protein)